MLVTKNMSVSANSSETVYAAGPFLIAGMLIPNNTFDLLAQRVDGALQATANPDVSAATTLTDRFSFDGSGDYISYAIDVHYTGDFAIEVGLYVADYSSWVILFNTEVKDEFQLIASADRTVQLYRNGALVLQTSAGAVPVNTAFRVALARSGATLKIFVDGVEQATTSNTSTFGAAGRSLVLGGRTQDWAHWLNGYIFSIAVSRSALFSSSYTTGLFVAETRRLAKLGTDYNAVFSSTEATATITNLTNYEIKFNYLLL